MPEQKECPGVHFRYQSMQEKLPVAGPVDVKLS